MNNLTGVCLIRHHINSWDQVQATLIELDKYCDKILLFSYQQRFSSQLMEIKNAKLVVKYLPLSASVEAIEKYLMDCINLTPTKIIFGLEAGECFHQDDTSNIFVDTLHLLEEKKVAGLDFPMKYIHNKNHIALDRNLQKRQLRMVKKSHLVRIDLSDGMNLIMGKKEYAIKSECYLHQYGVQPGREVLGLSRYKGEHPLSMNEWISNRDQEIFCKQSPSPLKSINYCLLQLEKITGKRIFQTQKYRHLS